MKNLLTIIGGIALLGLSSCACAATITYNLIFSNALLDGPTYATVSIADGADAAVDGNVDFSIAVNEAAFDLTGATNFGMQTFAFNYDVTSLTGTPEITAIAPDVWDVTKNNGSVSEFGKFDLDLKTDTGNDRTLTLDFSITNVIGDTLENYAISTNDEMPYLFATHIAGFADTACTLDSGDAGTCTSAYFSGGPIDRGLEPPAVPIPASVWLFGSGLIGLVGIARRKA